MFLTLLIPIGIGVMVGNATGNGLLGFGAFFAAAWIGGMVWQSSRGRM